MAHLSGIRIGNHARELTAALMLGAAIVSFVPGQTAYAARAISTDAGDSGSGGDQGPRTPGTSHRETTPDDGVRCSAGRPDGTIDFYLPGEEIIVGGKRYHCTSNGQWMVTGRTETPGMNTTPGGGVYTQAP